MFSPHIYGKLPGLYTAGETALADSPLFREHRLRLYRKCVHFSCQSPLIQQYVAVKDHIPVLKFSLGLFLNNNGHPSYLRGTAHQPPKCLIYKKNMMQGQVDEVLAHLEPLLNRPNRPYRKRHVYIPVPSEYHKTMARLHMIEKQTDHIWFPTAYGDSLGLLDGYMVSAAGKPCHTFVIRPDRMERLRKAMTWNQTCWEKPRAFMSVEERWEKLQQGLPSNNVSAVGPVKAFGAMPLADYMASNPKEAEKLHRKFGDISTYQEAADRVFQACQKANSAALVKHCRDLIAALIQPLLRADKLPADNLAAQPIQTLLRQPFPTPLMGAAIAAGQPCLLQNTRLILADFFKGNADKLQTSCLELTSNLIDCLKARERYLKIEEIEERYLDTEEMEGMYLNAQEIEDMYNLLFLVFIEPFALLNQSTISVDYEKEESL